MKRMLMGLMVFFLCVTVHVTVAMSAKNASLRIETSAGNLWGSFMKDGRTIYFEAQRGKLNPRNDPDAPKYAIDIRIKDSNQIPFLVRIGGNRPINPQWYEDQAIFEEFPVDDYDRLMDFYMAQELFNELKKVKVPSRHRFELKEIVNFLSSLKEEDFFDNDLEGLSPEASSSKYKHKATVRYKGLDDIPILQHSALRLRMYTKGGTLKYEFNTCNHGTCADSGKMSTGCSGEWGRNDLKSYIKDQMCDSYTSKCNLGSKCHSCNNDTKLQYKATRDKGVSKSKAKSICSWPEPFAPGCN